MIKNDVFKRIVEKRDDMSKAQRDIANYLIEHSDTAPFLTASKLAKNAKVGEATVIRFASFLGYSGYPDMQRHLQEAMQEKLTSAHVFSQTTSENEDPKNILKEVFTDDKSNIDMTLNQINYDDFQNVVQEIINAKRIYIVAYRSAKSMGELLAFYLDLVLQNTEMVKQGDGVSEHILDISDDDLVIGLGFSRYTKRTVEVLKYVKQRGAKTVVITDHLLSPLAPYGDRTLYAVSDINSFITSYSAPLTLINALLTAVTRSEQKQVKERLKYLESLWETFDVFYD